MKRLIKYVPNSITCLNLLAGCLACVFAFYQEFNTATWLIIGAVFFDFIDGFAARLLKAYSPLGKELDSLADMVSFGFAPAVMVFAMLRYPLDISAESSLLPFAAFALTIASALRLAKFNIDTRQTSSFIGLPTPANALFWVFLVNFFMTENQRRIGFYFDNLDGKIKVVKWAIEENLQSSAMQIGEISLQLFLGIMLILIAGFCYLMISEIPMFSLKFSNWSWKDNALRYIFLLISLLLLIVLKTLAFPLIIVIYVLTSVFYNLLKREKRTADTIV